MQRADAHKFKGNLAFKNRKYGDALEHYKDGMKAIAEFTEADTNLTATKHLFHALLLNQSFMYYHLASYVDAVNSVDKAIGVHRIGLGENEMAKAYYRRGQAKLKMNDRDREEAKQDLKKAAELAPADETILLSLSNAG